MADNQSTPTPTNTQSASSPADSAPIPSDTSPLTSDSPNSPADSKTSVDNRPPSTIPADPSIPLANTDQSPATQSADLSISPDSESTPSGELHDTVPANSLVIPPSEASPSAAIQDMKPPPADSNLPKTSFTDILEGKTQPSSPPISPSIPQSPRSPVSPKPSSFADLLKEHPAPTLEPSINIEPIVPPKQSQPPIETKEIKQDDLQKQTEERLKVEVESRRQKAIQKRKDKRDENLNKIISLLQKKGKINNADVREDLIVSQTTATDYLHTLVKNGKIKKEGRGKATFYSL